MKKKKESSGDGQSWNAFAGGSFPNYFGEPEGTKVEKKSQPVNNLLDVTETSVNSN